MICVQWFMAAKPFGDKKAELESEELEEECEQICRDMFFFLWFIYFNLSEGIWRSVRFNRESKRVWRVEIWKKIHLVSQKERKSRKIHLSGVEVSFVALFFSILRSRMLPDVIFFGNLTEHKHNKKKQGSAGVERKCSNSVININLFLCKLKND